ncbi:unnamed protein product [Darwinula stevensoni]|uniref:Major facilitator superfamily (MFS) profile domain-containing protein n=1 Tax=Darwinula stevensoni TaxID=69355 RepID=A0A7R9A9L4_9CRUS|nr:unnamed protein product [Darwinula stevensoni]CAG0897521.1 unnamed protein product [Darwinula stevensoni]
MTIQLLFSIGKTWSPNFYVIAFLGFCEATAFPSAYINAYVIAVELVGKEHRGWVNGAFSCLWVVGLVILAFVAWLLQGHWIHLSLAANLPILLFYTAYWFLPESPRWLMTRGRLSEAEEVVVKIARMNGLPTRREKISGFLQMVSEHEKRASPQYWTLLRTRSLLRRVITNGFGFLAVVQVYSGLHLDFGNLGANPYINFALLGIVELPAYIFAYWTMERLGRRWMNAIFLLMSAISMIFVPVAPAGSSWALLPSLMAKFSATAAFLIIYQQQAEVFPTNLRSTAASLVRIFSGVIGMVNPYLMKMGDENPWIPYGVFGAVNLGAAIAVSFTPETLKKDLPDGILEAENLDKESEYWSWPELTRFSRTRPGRRDFQMNAVREGS